MTIEELEEMLARAMAVTKGLDLEDDNWMDFMFSAKLVTTALSKSGIPTEALIAVMRGEAGIYPKEPTIEMYTAAWRACGTTDKIGHIYEAMTAASPWEKKAEPPKSCETCLYHGCPSVCSDAECYPVGNWPTSNRAYIAWKIREKK